MKIGLIFNDSSKEFWERRVRTAPLFNDGIQFITQCAAVAT